MFGGALEDFVVDVSEVLNKGHLQTSPNQIATQYIPVDLTAGVAEVIDRDPAAINAHFAGVSGLKGSARRVRVLVSRRDTAV